MEPIIPVYYVTLFDVARIVAMIVAAGFLFRIGKNGKGFYKRFAVLMSILAIEVLFATIAVIYRNNEWYPVIKIIGGTIAIGGLGWFVLWVTDKN